MSKLIADSAADAVRGVIKSKKVTRGDAWSVINLVSKVLALEHADVELKLHEYAQLHRCQFCQRVKNMPCKNTQDMDPDYSFNNDRLCNMMLVSRGGGERSVMPLIRHPQDHA